jgi:hypothetical protein
LRQLVLPKPVRGWTLTTLRENLIKIQEFHRRLFASSSDSLRREIKRITGMEVREATAEVEPVTGAVVQAFTTGNVVQVFQLVGSVTTETWSGTGPGGP